MDFQRLYEQLEPFKELESPSFVQGMLIGLLCADNDIQEAVWIKKLMEEAQMKSVKESLLKLLDELYQSTNKGLNGSGFELVLCLPADHESAVFRAAMLGQLCEGVLYGLGLGGGLNEMEIQVTSEIREIVADFSDIAQIDFQALSVTQPQKSTSPHLLTQTDEPLSEVHAEVNADPVNAHQINQDIDQDLMELTEFVKVGVLMLNELMNPTQAAPIMDDSAQGRVH